ncbi:MAG TPA: 4-hydroxy-tetrahydrodipicolinate synthase [Acidisarcina sp.]|nr:4-hydroxy-tetrahydrodipicolinate synthase [Acidisarcina sp.]
MELTGCGTALVTPFRHDGSLDEHALFSLAQWQIDSGIHFLVACGTTAETPTLTYDEWVTVIRIVAEASGGRVPVWAGCTHNSTREAVQRARVAAKIPGVSAILTANPYYNKPTQEGQYQHFKAIGEAVDMPVVIYNIPSRTGTNLEPKTIARLAQDVPTIQAAKESSGVLSQITELINLLPSNFKVFAGDDPVALPVISVGGAGLVSVASNEIPSEMAEMVNAALQNEWSIARRINRKFYPLMLANFWETSPSPVKYVMELMGKINSTVRLPLVPPQPETRRRLERLAGELGLLKFAPAPEGDMRMF